MLQTKNMSIVSMDETGKGLAELATLSAVDNDGDTYEPGAFSWKEGGHQWAMMMPAHNRRAIPFGKARVYEDGDKAFAELHLNLLTTTGKEWHQALLFDFKVGKPVQEWSFGYSAEYIYRVSAGGRIRVLNKVDVDEVSPVLRGAGKGTRTISIKEAGAIKDAELRDEYLGTLLTGLGELAEAIDADPGIVSASGMKQLREIHDAIGRVFTGADGEISDEVKDALSRDTALTHFLMFGQGRRRFDLPPQ